MKAIQYIFLLLLIPYLGSSQAFKKTIGFIPYTDPENADEEYRELAYKNIYDAALRVFVNTQRFDVLDRLSFDILKIEKEFQKGEDLANVEIIAQGKVKAAELLAVAKLSTFTITESDDGNGYSVYITAEFKQLDVETGQAKSAFQMRAEAIDKQSGTLGLPSKRISTIEQAISEAVNKMEEDLAKWIKRQFRMILPVIDIDKAEQCVIVEGGADVGLTTDYEMKLIWIKTYGKGKRMKKRSRKIGDLSFLKEEGVDEELTILKIKSKKDWQAFLKLWETEPDSIYATEDI
jgi:hypothetical protein